MELIIAITGTPGTGKSLLAKELSLLLDAKVIGLTSFIKQHNLSQGYDDERKSMVVDPKDLAREMIPLIQKSKEEHKSLIIEGHLSHTLPSSLFDYCIVLRCKQPVLRERLQKRKYHVSKVRENIDCENFDVCGAEAQEAGFRIIKVETADSLPRSLANKIFRKIVKNQAK